MILAICQDENSVLTSCADWDKISLSTATFTSLSANQKESAKPALQKSRFCAFGTAKVSPRITILAYTVLRRLKLHGIRLLNKLNKLFTNNLYSVVAGEIIFFKHLWVKCIEKYKPFIFYLLS